MTLKISDEYGDRTVFILFIGSNYIGWRIR